MRHFVTTLILIAIITAMGCASSPEQADSASAQSDNTEMRCEKRSYSGSRLGVSKCRRVKASDDEG